MASFFVAALVYLIGVSSQPVLSDLTPAPNTQAPPGPVTIRATARSDGQPIQRIVMTLDGQRVKPAVEVRSAHEWVINFTADLRRGPHDVEVAVSDAAGQTRTHAWSFTASGPRIAPSLAFTGPPSGSSLPAGMVRIAVQASTDTDITSARIEVGGRQVPTFVSPWADRRTSRSRANGDLRRWVIFAEPTLGPGSYQARVTVEDTDGDRASAVLSFTVAADVAQASARFFPSTGQYVRDPFKSFWEQHNGAALFGDPISTEYVDERGKTVQYFQRARLERNEDGGVALGLLGREALSIPVERVDDPGDPAVRYFAETGHTLAGKFREFWEQHGGIALFGLPLTEEIEEGGRRVQYFERVRLELRPTEDGTGMTVEIAPLGEQLARAHGVPTS
ncbi:MAG: Ig-like domain-containing protein [Sphaerobacter sp.]|nr:Ig-like domain-containing protein [Sphaerobacter sp.]